MDLKELETLNRECAKDSEEFFNEFVKLFNKRFKKGNKRMTIINFIHLPLNGILNMIAQDKKNLMCEIFPELPDTFIRFMRPFIKLKKSWGKIPNDEWVKEYGRLHSKQFDEWFPSEEEKKNFEEWFRRQNPEKV